MNTFEIRETFLDFFVERDHRRVASAPLIPQDPTVLLNIAGMLPFAPYFAGDAEPPAPRIVSYQKCVRTNDIENVGRTARHLSFFEMLGNFSFGDYYKRDAIRWAWELSVDHFGLDPERIWASAHVNDDEAVEIILEETDIPRERIQRFDSDNFWWTGQAGSAGYCGEFFYDKGPEYGEDGGPAVDDERFVEYYNLVFTEFVCDDDGNIVGELPAKNVDTGLGLARLATILQDVPTLYETDVWVSLLAAASRVTGVERGDSDEHDVSLKVLAEHARATAFLIADGVLPAKEGRGYVLRRLLRRAVRHSHLLGVTDADARVLPPMIDAVIEVMRPGYPELERQRELIMRVATAEEAGFRDRLAAGLAMLDDELADLGDGDPLSGDVAFQLHDTYGFPIDLTAEIAADAGLELDQDRFDELMTAQQERARAAAKSGSGGVPASVYREAAAATGSTEFVGYDHLRAESTVGALVTVAGLVDVASEGDELEVVLPRTPFYAEGGGQVGDAGLLVTPSGRLEVLDTQEAIEGVSTHRVRVVAGEVTPGQEVVATVDPDRRIATARSHSATHVLHATIKEVLGEHAQQAGSLVTPGRLRFDFPHFEGVADDQLATIEGTINERVLRDPTVRTEIMDLDDARAAGAVANFGDKYGDVVRVVTIGDFSKELCGGTHVPHGAEIGTIVIAREESIGANTRRVEALTGIDAYRYLTNERLVAEEVARTLNTRSDEAVARIESLVERLRAAEKELVRLRQADLAGRAVDLADEVERDADGLGIVAVSLDGLDMDGLRQVAGDIRQRLGERGVAVVGTGSDDGKAQLVAALTDDLVEAGVAARDVLQPAAKLVGGGAGGKGGMAQAGGRDGSRLDEALQRAADEARELARG
ncbi:alanine--tRNA ligase [Salsipaludibacter albus]|uniref:alanine--tRNA ligase n=1 Tax=Salsipaludibacter albus TaxID=2849650 RepID=UPI001EE4E3B1|nr:alanine--tRNA ligase [Salsipaludibacter albus]